MKFLAWIAFFIATPAFADRVYVEATRGVGVDAELEATTTELIRSTVTEDSDHDLVNNSSEAEDILRPKLMRLGATLMLIIEKTRGGKIVFSSQLKAAHEDELDLIAQKLTRAVLAEKKPIAKEKVSEVTETQTEEGLHRRSTRRGYSLGLGPTLLNNLNVSGIGLKFNGGIFWDLNIAMLSILTDLSWRDDAILLSVGLGAKYFITETWAAPYVGGEFGVGASRIGHTALLSGSYSAGFAGALVAGVHLFRTSSVNFEIGARVGLLFSATTQGLPFASSVGVALHWM